MSCPLVPMPGFIVATAEKAPTQTASGFHLPKAAQEKSRSSIVVAVGSEVSGIADGDRLIHKAYSATELSIDGVDFLIIDSADVFAVVSS